MNNQKGMGHIATTICIVIIIISIIGMICYAKIRYEQNIKQDYETDMLVLQGKVRILSQEATIQKNEEFLKGKKVSDNLEDEEIKELLEKNIITQEEENFEKYYILENSNLEEMGLKGIELLDGKYIVNYATCEIIYTKGVKIGENNYYKLTELLNLKDGKDEENENKDEDVQSENNEQEMELINETQNEIQEETNN